MFRLLFFFFLVLLVYVLSLFKREIKKKFSRFHRILNRFYFGNVHSIVSKLKFCIFVVFENEKEEEKNFQIRKTVAKRNKNKSIVYIISWKFGNSDWIFYFFDSFDSLYNQQIISKWVSCLKLSDLNTFFFQWNHSFCEMRVFFDSDG